MKCKIAGREVELDIEDRLNTVRGAVANTDQDTEYMTYPNNWKPAGGVLKTATPVANPALSPILIIYGKPLGKPRMTRKDKWAQRKCVLRYWAWCDLARHVAFLDTQKKDTLDSPTRIQVVAYFTHKTRTGPHLLKPDGDNILKGVCDALFVNDEMIYDKAVKKLWTGGRERVEVLVTKEPHVAREEA